METIYNSLVELSVQRTLSDSDRATVANLYEEVCKQPRSAQRADCMTIITNRLWVM